jgi:catechol 2,3-dioxygenase
VGIIKIEHVKMRVTDIEEAVGFNTDVAGLSEVGRDGDSVYMGCGLDDNYDIALTPGGTGAIHTAFAVHGTEDLAYYEKRLKAAGVDAERRTNGSPGETAALRFVTPGPGTFELVVMEKQENYVHPSKPKFRTGAGFAPRDLDHVNLIAEDPGAMYEFLTTVLDFAGSDIFYAEPNVVGAAWVRVGTLHHDLAIMMPLRPVPGQTLHHVAFTMDSFDHMKTAADLLASHDIKLEAGLARHDHGGNLFGYFQTPGGNRYEITAEMARAHDREYGPNISDDIGFSSWGAQPFTESFYLGS